MTETIEDWDWEDIKAALRKRGTSVAQLERQHHRAPKTFHQVKSRCWPDAQKKIAKALGKTPREIWPSRYPPSASPKTGSVRANHSTASKSARGDSHIGQLT